MYISWYVHTYIHTYKHACIHTHTYMHACIHTYMHTCIPTLPSLHLRQSSFSNPSVALPTSQLNLQPFRCLTYATVHSLTFLSLLLRHKFFTYVTWRAAHDPQPSFLLLFGLNDVSFPSIPLPGIRMGR